jgi:hypothetical protein
LSGVLEGKRGKVLGIKKGSIDLLRGEDSLREKGWGEHEGVSSEEIYYKGKHITRGLS